MPAHLAPLPRCDRSGCTSPASYVLRNTVNAPIGVYCERHAPAALKDFEEAQHG